MGALDDAFEITDLQKGRSQMESGVVRWGAGEAVPTLFNPDTGVTTGANGTRLLARVDQELPQIFALHIEAALGSDVANSGYQIECGLPPDFVSFGAGMALIIDYGDLTGRHRLIADCRSGVYQLPAVSFVQVSVVQWTSTGLALAFAVQATLSRSPALGEARYFTLTGTASIAAAATKEGRFGQRAVAIDLWSIDQNPFATQPVLRGQFIGLLRDYLTPQFVPPWGPVLLAPGTHQVFVTNDGAATCNAKMQVILQP